MRANSDSSLPNYPSTPSDHLTDFQGSLAGINVDELMREDRDAELAADHNLT